MSQGEAYECAAVDCDVEIERGGLYGRCCSSACYQWDRRHPGEPRPAVEMVKCEACVAVFPRRGQKRFCSKFCSDVFYGGRKIGARGGVIVCLICGERKAVYNPTNDKACGACRPEWEARRSARWKAANPERVRASEHRRATSTERRTYHRELSRRLYKRKPRPPCPRRLPVRSTVAWSRARVSITARPAARTFIGVICSWCGEHFIRGPRYTGTCCSSDCQKRHDRRKYRRTHRRKGCGLTERERQIVFARDKYICQLCGWDLDMDAAPGTPLSATIDHTVARARGGFDILPWVQAAHQLCNSRKGAMSMDEWRALE